ILCRTGVQQVSARVGQWMAQVGLALNTQKTCIRHAWTEPFTFLGYTFGVGYTTGTGKPHLRASPSKKALQRFRAAVREKLKRGNPAPLPEVIRNLNRVIRVWGQYFCYGSVGPARYAMDRYIVERVRAFLRKRHKLDNKGARRFSYDVIRNQLG